MSGAQPTPSLLSAEAPWVWHELRVLIAPSRRLEIN
jgi:hypothetical protein